MSEPSDFLAPGGALKTRLFGRLLGLGSAQKPALAPGTRIGPYRVTGTLGVGGSAHVYLAERADGQFEQRVALKLVRSDERLVEAFRRERQILASLSHPGIASLFDGGQLEDGCLWFAMEPVIGRRIDVFVREGKLGWRERVALLVEVVVAVQHAHSRLLVHRDIKPSNILVDASGRPKLLDFGIAIAPEEAPQNTGVRAFTPEYASPEQIAGGAVTIQSDIYQLGLVLERMLRPDGSWCSTLPARPGRVDAADLEMIVARACAHDAHDRYPTVAAFRDDLGAVASCRPIAERRGDILYRAERLARRHPFGAMSFVLAVVAILGGGSWYGYRLSQERAMALARAQQLQMSFDAVSQILSGAAAGIDQKAWLEFMAAGTDSFGPRFSEVPAQRLFSAELLANTYLDLDAIKPARAFVAKVLEEQKQVSSTDAVSYARLELAGANAAMADGDLAAATALLTAARGRLAGQDEAKEAQFLLEDAEISLLGVTSNYAEARQRLDRLIAALRESGQYRRLLAFQLFRSVRMRDRDIRSAERVEEIRESLQLYAAELGTTSRWALRAERRLAYYLSMDGQHAEAANLLDAQRALVLSSVGRHSPEYSQVVNLQGVIAKESGDRARALEYFSDALGLIRETGRGDTMDATDALHNIAELQEELGRWDAAADHYRQALELRLRLLPDDAVSVMLDRASLAATLCALRRDDEAAPLFERAMAAAATLPPGHGQRVTVAMYYADCELRGGRYDEARIVAKRELAGSNEPIHREYVRELTRRVLRGVDLDAHAYGLD
jgi:eukaryotic-like serine/threonine-protein kinase